MAILVHAPGGSAAAHEPPDGDHQLSGAIVLELFTVRCQ
jgi:hypothetical protein